MTEVRISISADDDPESLIGLYQWLVNDDSLIRAGNVKLATLGAPESMGTLQAIDIVLTHLTGSLSLALAFASWRKSRSNPPPVTIVSNDIRLLVQDHSEETIRQICELGEPKETDAGEDE
jgi:hypothetical protein